MEWSIAICVILAAALIALVYYLDARSVILGAIDWLNGLGPWAPAAFIAMVVLVVLSLLPGVVFTVGAGFLFGLAEGTIYMVVATTLGASLAFLCARYLFSKKFAAYVMSHRKVRLVNDQLTREGWRFILLTRLVPMFPFKLSNYVFGLSQFTFRDFFIGTFFGIIPFTLTNVYIGSIAGDITTLGAGGVARTPLEWIVYGLGFIVAVGAVIHITRVARSALNQHVHIQGDGRSDQPNEKNGGTEDELSAS